MITKTTITRTVLVIVSDNIISNSNNEPDFWLLRAVKGFNPPRSSNPLSYK